MHIVLAHIVIKTEVYLFRLFREENCDDDDGMVENFFTMLEDIMAEWLS